LSDEDLSRITSIKNHQLSDIKFSVLINFQVELRLFDVAGAEVETLINKSYKPGNYNVDWNAAYYASGVYFYRIKAFDFKSAQKLNLLK
jgi:hypothetical protein